MNALNTLRISIYLGASLPDDGKWIERSPSSRPKINTRGSSGLTYCKTPRDWTATTTKRKTIQYLYSTSTSRTNVKVLEGPIMNSPTAPDYSRSNSNSPQTPAAKEIWDLALPLKGVVICCTSIPDEKRVSHQSYSGCPNSMLCLSIFFSC